MSEREDDELTTASLERLVGTLRTAVARGQNARQDLSGGLYLSIPCGEDIEVGDAVVWRDGKLWRARN